MALEKVLTLRELPVGGKKAVKVGETEILLVHTAEGGVHAVEAKCPHAGAPLVDGAVCDGRLVCPWHMGTFELGGERPGALVEPPPLRSLKHYAVKVEGDAILVDAAPRNAPSVANYDDNAPAERVGEDRHIVTIGAGAAAAALVCTLRQEGFGGRITMIDPVADEPTDRTILSKMALAGKKPPTPLWTPEEQAQLKVERVAERVEQLDGEAGVLHWSGGGELLFDAALLAPGGAPKRLGVPGEELPLVHAIRHVADVEAIAAGLGSETAAKGKRVVLIGDSFIAFEAASALTGRGLQATVVCRSAEPFAKKFGKAAEAILALHRAAGVRLLLGEETREITAGGVGLKSGETLAAELVIVAVGVRVATDFAHGLQLEEDGGVPVSGTLKAGAKLWVGGDAASVNGVRIEHWRLAEQHGRAAAHGMLRRPGAHATLARESSEEVPFFWTAHFGKRFGYVGHAEAWDRVEVDGVLGGQQGAGEPKFLAYYVKGNAVRAVLGCGRDTGLAMLAERMRKTLTLEQARGAAGVDVSA